MRGQDAPEKIIWKENRLLSWSDFQATAQKDASFHANTNAGISYAWGLQGERDDLVLNYEVEAFFYPHLSWVQKDKASEHLLAHEQLHFDICELHARRLRQRLKEISGKRLTVNSRERLKALYELTDRERSEMQSRYDSETDHSSNRLRQLKWQAYIRQELDKLNAYQL